MEESTCDIVRPPATHETTACELLHALWQTHDRLQICFTRLFREHGLTPAQFQVLCILKCAGKPLPILEVAERTITVVPGITGLVDRLEKQNWVKRIRCQEDRRVVYVGLTDGGVALLDQIDEPVTRLRSHLLGDLSLEEQQAGVRLLEKLRHQAETLPQDLQAE